MPMLITLRMRFPVCPVHAPLRTRSANERHAVEHVVHRGHDVLAVDDDALAARRAQRHVQDGAAFRDVDLLAAEHGIDARAQAALVGQREQQPQGLVGDAVLREVERRARPPRA